MKNYFDHIRENPSNLCCVPMHERSAELCAEALRIQGLSIHADQIPANTEPVSDEPIYLKLNAHPSKDLAFTWVPKRMKTKEMCEQAVKVNAYCFMSVPEEFKTFEMCRYAVLHVHEMVRHVPQKYLLRLFRDFLDEFHCPGNKGTMSVAYFFKKKANILNDDWVVRIKNCK